MKSRTAPANARTQPTATREGLTAVRTGAHCPVTGLWTTAEKTEDPRLFSEGNIMPAQNGQPVAWIFVQGPRTALLLERLSSIS